MDWLLDSGVLLAYFTVVIGIGLNKGRGDKTMEGFAVGNRNIPWWAVLASILAAETSAASEWVREIKAIDVRTYGLKPPAPAEEDEGPPEG